MVLVLRCLVVTNVTLSLRCMQQCDSRWKFEARNWGDYHCYRFQLSTSNLAPCCAAEKREKQKDPRVNHPKIVFEVVKLHLRSRNRVRRFSVLLPSQSLPHWIPWLRTWLAKGFQGTKRLKHVRTREQYHKLCPTNWLTYNWGAVTHITPTLIPTHLY